ncbi:MAG: hypothetical protein ACXW4U_04045 [Anaerolineales bacterium]
MKKLIQVSIVLFLAITLIVGPLQVAGDNMLASGGNACRVGWNTRTGTCLDIAPLYEGPGIKPLVGWNG